MRFLKLLSSFKVTCLFVGMLNILMAGSMLAKGVMQGMAEFKVPPTLLASPHYDDAMSWVFLHMGTIGVLIITNGLLAEDSAKKAWAVRVRALMYWAYTFLNIQRSNNYLGKALKQVIFISAIALLSACQNEEGKDTHPEIPEFPKTSNPEVKIKILHEFFDEIFYNDKSLIVADSHGLTFYDLKKQKTKVFKGKFDNYENGSIIYHISDQDYFSINLIDLSEKKLEAVNENPKYQAILDSLAAKQPANTDVDSEVADSIYVKYFCNKYEVNDRVLPYTSYSAGNLYVHTSTKGFILLEPQNCLANLKSYNIEQKPILKPEARKDDYRKYERDYTNESKIFKKFDYSMTSKSWESSGGGNHFIPAIPLYNEYGFNYYKFVFGDKEGRLKINIRNKFVILADIASGNNKYFFTHYNHLYEISY